MKRRSFLQLLGLTAAAPTAILAKTDKSELYMFGDSTTEASPGNNPFVKDAPTLEIRDTVIYDRALSEKESKEVLNYLYSHKADKWSAEDLAKMDAKHSKPLIFNKLGVGSSG